MKSEDIYNALTGIDDGIIEEADNFSFAEKKARKKQFWKFSAAAAVFIAVAVIFIGNIQNFQIFDNSSNETAKDNVFSTENSVSEEKTENNIADVPENMTEISPETETSSQSSSKTAIEPKALSTAVYPQLCGYPLRDENGNEDSKQYSEWSEDIRELQSIEVDLESIGEFSDKMMQEFLTEDDKENKLLSPLNVYMALAVLAETANGDTREQILGVLGVESIDELRDEVNRVWRKNYRDDGYMKCILANSLWLSDTVKYKKSTVNRIADKYYASVFSGTMGSESYNKMLNTWISDQTNGLLSSQLETDPESVMMLVSTLLYQTKWRNEFNSENTKEGIFRSPDGEMTAEFMNKSSYSHYYWGENFSAVALDLDIGGRMWFVLPDEDVTAEEMFSDKEVLNLVKADYSELYDNYSNSKFLKVNLSVPKFDIMQERDISDGLAKLGMTDAFDSTKADLSSVLSDWAGAFVSKVEHGIRVKIDEEGVAAAAYTAIMYAGSAAPPSDEVDLVLDRPFAFVITLSDGIPLFSGVVNTP